MTVTHENFNILMPYIFEEEGGYVDNPEDPGGATKYGITLKTLRAWKYPKKVTKEDIKNLSKEDATEIYKSEYWDKICGDKLPVGLSYCILDYAINSGPSRAIKCIQKIVGSPQDGCMGVQTLSKITEDLSNQTSSIELIRKVTEDRIRFVRSLKTYKTFGKGWEARIKRVQKRSLDLLTKGEANETLSVDPLIFDHRVSYSPKSRESEVSISSVLNKIESKSFLISSLSGLSAALSGSGPVQIALGIVIVASFLYGIYYIHKRKVTELK